MLNLLLAINLLTATVNEDAIVKGNFSALTTEAPLAGCTPDPCWASCSTQINNPYCSVWEATCIEKGGGGVECHCQYFCVTTEGGVGHSPNEQGPHWLENVGPDGWDETGGV